jgi:hypothetical protein
MASLLTKGGLGSICVSDCCDDGRHLVLVENSVGRVSINGDGVGLE